MANEHHPDGSKPMDRPQTRLRFIAKAAAVACAGAAVFVLLPTFTRSQPVSTPIPPHSMSKMTHKVVIQVTQNDPAVMNMALNNTENLVKYYKAKGEPLQVELVAYGAGLSMMRDDTSPVKDRLSAISGSAKNVVFTGCGNTLTAQSKQENKEITLVPQARIVPAGIARIVELEEQGWTYVRP
jgi:intracellular sulfur oxidation DsrE/DsrF family protein